MSEIELIKGTLDMLILRVLADEGRHGYAIARRIQETSREALKVEEGSLYPALHRLERRKWIRSEWGLSENNRRAKYYSLTAVGRRQLEREARTWRRLSEAVSLVLEGA